MTEEQIQKEYKKLLMAQIETASICNYYMDQHIRVLVEMRDMH